MTWYASQLMTTGAPSILAAIERIPLFSDHVFCVTNPIRHNWHTAEIKHSVPDEGLVFIRPICDPTGHIADWHGDELLPWESFENVPGEDVQLTPHAVCQLRTELDAASFTAADVLRVAKKLNTDTNVPVAFYYCFCWGGVVEVEYAWIFDNSERVLIRQTDTALPNASRFLEIDTGTETIRDGDVLMRTLRALKCDLPTPFFAPHTRAFSWDQHRLRLTRIPPKHSDCESQN